RARSVIRIDFGDHEHALALAGDRLGRDFFGAAVAVDLGGIDERHPEIDTEAQRRDFIIVRALLFAHASGALAKRGNARAIGESHSFHAPKNVERSTRLRRLAFTKRAKIE